MIIYYKDAIFLRGKQSDFNRKIHLILHTITLYDLDASNCSRLNTCTKIISLIYIRLIENLNGQLNII